MSHEALTTPKGEFPIVALKYVDSSIYDRQHSVDDSTEPQVSDVAGFLAKETKDSVLIAREVFVDGKRVDLRGALSIPRCAVVGKIKRL